MIPENFKTLIEKLKVKTIKNEAIWKKTTRDNEFIIELRQGAITIDMYGGPESLFFIDMNVFNKDGDLVDTILYSTDTPLEYSTLTELHSMAKRAYYKVDQTFINFFKELDSNDTIGNDKENNILV